MSSRCVLFIFFFFNDTATTEIYTLSLHDALPILGPAAGSGTGAVRFAQGTGRREASDNGKSSAMVQHRRVSIAAARVSRDRKSTRLNSSHANISYAVFCLKKKKDNDCDYFEQTHK